MRIVIANTVAILALSVGLFAPPADADPNTCPDTGGNVKTYTTYVPCPRWDFLPERGGGNHRWPDGSDD